VSDVLSRYRRGLGFRRGDVLAPREGCNPSRYNVADDKVTVLSQSSLAPHSYVVVGENRNPRDPSDELITFEINGHEWQRTEMRYPTTLQLAFILTAIVVTLVGWGMGWIVPG
jgi:hypothetical protein